MTVKLNWHRTREQPYWCSLKGKDGRLISLELWPRRPEPLLCRVCQHPPTDHERPFVRGRVGTFDSTKTPCNYGNAGVHCGCPDWIPPARRLWDIDIVTEVRFRGLVAITNGEHKTRSTKRAAWRGEKVKSGTTTSMVMLYAMPLGSLLAVARSGLPLTLKPTKRRYAHGQAVIGADELGRLAVAVDAALEAGEWSIESETPGPGLPAAVAQMEAFR